MSVHVVAWTCQHLKLDHLSARNKSWIHLGLYHLYSAEAETNSKKHLNMDGWKMLEDDCSLLVGRCYFLVSGSQGGYILSYIFWDFCARKQKHCQGRLSIDRWLPRILPIHLVPLNTSTLARAGPQSMAQHVVVAWRPWFRFGEATGKEMIAAC